MNNPTRTNSYSKYSIYLTLVGFLATPKNIFSLQDLAISLLILTALYYILFTRNVRLILAHIIIITATTAWMGDFLPVAMRSGLNFSVIISVISIITYFIKFKTFMLSKITKNLKITIFILILYLIFDIYSNVISVYPNEWRPIIGSYLKTFSILLYANHLGILEKFNGSIDTIFLLLSGIWGISLNYAFKLLSGNVVDATDISGLRDAGAFDPNFLAVITSAVLLLFTINLINKRNIKYSGVGAILSLIAILGSGSRTALISFGVGLIIVLFYNANLMFNKKSGIIIAIVIITGIFGFEQFIKIMPQLLVERFTNVKKGYEDAREMSYLNALKFIQKEPIIGNGKSYYKKNESIIAAGAHNTFLNMFAEGGIFFIIIFLIYILRTYLIFKKIQVLPNKSLFMGILFVYIIANLGLTLNLGDFVFTTYFSIFIIGFNKVG